MKALNSMRILGIGAVAVALTAGCSASAVRTPTAVVPAAVPAGGTINANLTDRKIGLDHTTIRAGSVTFVVKNSGAVAHELVLIRTDVAQDKVAANAEEAGKVDETGNIGETGDMDVGSTKSFTVTLPVGNYVLICNEVGHYASGMHAAFTVN